MSKICVFFVICAFICLSATNAKIAPKAKVIPGVNPETDTQKVQNGNVRYNKVTVGGYSMPSERVRAGLERLQYLLDYNTKNEELMREMHRHFQTKYQDLDWHLVLEDVTSGAFPQQYVYYKFDRNTTEMFVAGYKYC